MDMGMGTGGFIEDDGVDDDCLDGDVEMGDADDVGDMGGLSFGAFDAFGGGALGKKSDAKKTDGNEPAVPPVAGADADAEPASMGGNSLNLDMPFSFAED